MLTRNYKKSTEGNQDKFAEIVVTYAENYFGIGNLYRRKNFFKVSSESLGTKHAYVFLCASYGIKEFGSWELSATFLDLETGKKHEWFIDDFDGELFDSDSEKMYKYLNFSLKTFLKHEMDLLKE